MRAVGFDGRTSPQPVVVGPSGPSSSQDNPSHLKRCHTHHAASRTKQSLGPEGPPTYAAARDRLGVIQVVRQRVRQCKGEV